MNLISKLNNMRIAILFFISVPILSEPWLGLGDHQETIILNKKIKDCQGEYIIPSKTYPISYGYVSSILDFNLEQSKNLRCKSFFEEEKKTIENTYNLMSIKLGFQSKADNMHFQKLGSRYYSNNNVYIDFSNVFSNSAFRLRATRDLDENKYFFDESYFSYKYENQIFTFGRISRWWSPSENINLILSNSARPAPGIEIKNYIPIKPKREIFRYIKTINYEFFINRLEKNREIKNALLFGNRVSIGVTNNLDISLLRLAQFGGKGRDVDLSTFLNMLAGKDNTSSNLSFRDQPGNQLAGVDWVYSSKNKYNTIFYGQIIGEDEAGYLPSRTIKLVGISFNLNDIEITLDHADTFSGKKDYTYNHALYKDGLRHYKIPIGANIDADSTKSLISFKKIINNTILDLEYSDVTLNENESSKNYWIDESVSFKQVNFHWAGSIKK